MTRISNFIDVLDEVFDADDGPLLVEYRRRLKPNGKFEPKSEDEEHPIHIQDIVKMTEEYAKFHPEKTSMKVNKNSANRRHAFGIAGKPASDTLSASKPVIDWSKRLPRTGAEVMSMPIDHPVRDVGTYDPDKLLGEAPMKISKLGMLWVVFTKTCLL